MKVVAIDQPRDRLRARALQAVLRMRRQAADHGTHEL